jgi:hypothetical protein
MLLSDFDIDDFPLPLAQNTAANASAPRDESVTAPMSKDAIAEITAPIVAHVKNLIANALSAKSQSMASFQNSLPKILANDVKKTTAPWESSISSTTEISKALESSLPPLTGRIALASDDPVVSTFADSSATDTIETLTPSLAPLAEHIALSTSTNLPVSDHLLKASNLNDSSMTPAPISSALFNSEITLQEKDHIMSVINTEHSALNTSTSLPAPEHLSTPDDSSMTPAPSSSTLSNSEMTLQEKEHIMSVISAQLSALVNEDNWGPLN